jgi:hypothetical protein
MNTIHSAELLKQYIILHNYGIEIADFEPMLKLFADDAILEFEDHRIGKFEGIDMIRGVFRRQGPSMPIVIGDISETGQIARAEYADEDKPNIKLGYISIEIEGEKIKKIFVGK